MQFISYLINGISLGSVYAIIALGYTMVYGIARYAELRTRRYHHGRRFHSVYDCHNDGRFSGCGYSGFGGCVYSAGRYDRASCIQTVASTRPRWQF